MQESDRPYSHKASQQEPFKGRFDDFLEETVLKNRLNEVE
jgi:hypothetical protein